MPKVARRCCPCVHFTLLTSFVQYLLQCNDKKYPSAGRVGNHVYCCPVHHTHSQTSQSPGSVFGLRIHPRVCSSTKCFVLRGQGSSGLLPGLADPETEIQVLFKASNRKTFLLRGEIHPTHQCMEFKEEEEMAKKSKMAAGRGLDSVSAAPPPHTSLEP